MSMRIAAGIFRHRRWVNAVFALAALGTAGTLGRLRINPDVASFFPPQDPVIGLTRALHHRPPHRTITLVLRAAGRGPEEITAVLPALVHALEGSGQVERVVALRRDFMGPEREWVAQSPLLFLPAAAVDHIRSRIDGPDRLAALRTSDRLLTEDPFRNGAVVQKDPFGLRFVDLQKEEWPRRLAPGSDYLVLKDPPLGIVDVIATEEWSDLEFSRVFMPDIRRRVGEVLEGSAVTCQVFGAHASALSRAEALSADLRNQSILSALFCFVFVAWFLRHWALSALLLVPCAIGITMTLCFGAAVFGSLSPLAVSIGAILVAQGVDFPIHYATRYFHARLRVSAPRAFIETHRALGRPMFLAATTTSAAFSVFLLSGFPGFRQFGALLAAGLGATVCATMTVFALLLVALDGQIPKQSPRSPRFICWCATPSLGRGLGATATALLLMGAPVLAMLRGVHLDSDPRSVAPKDDPAEAILEAVERDLGASVSPVFLLMPRAKPVEELRRAGEALRASGAVVSWFGPDGLVPTVAAKRKQAEIVERTRGWIPRALEDLGKTGLDAEDFSERFKSLDERLRASSPPLFALESERFRELRARYVYQGDDRERWIVRVHPERTPFDGTARRALDEALRSELGQDIQILSSAHLPDYFRDLLSADLRRLATLATLAVILLCLLGYGPRGLFALLPVTGGVGAVLAVSGLFGLPLNPMNMAAIPILIGGGVDAGLYYIAARRPGLSSDETLREVGPGIWATTMTTVIGFGCLGFSTTPAVASLGILVSVGMAAVLLVTLLVLPSVEGWLRPSAPAVPPTSPR